MIIEMFNGWYFFWVLLLCGITAALYFLLRNRSYALQRTVLFLLLAIGLVLHFTKVYYPPYSTDEARMLRDAWFVNICGANIALFPFLFFSKSKKVWDYMFYIGVISGLIAIFYPQEPLAKADQLGEMLDILRFYYHHWMLMAVPLLSALFGHHKPSYKRVLSAPTGLLMVMGFILLNQLLQSELGYIPLRSRYEFFEIGYKNSSYIWGPGENDAIGNFLALFCPKIFKTVPVGQYAGKAKYWPWFWMICPVYLLVPVLSFLVALVFDFKSFINDAKELPARTRALPGKIKSLFAPERVKQGIAGFFGSTKNNNKE